MAKTLVTSASSILRAPVLMLAIGKRLLPRAIDRNRVKRVAREAWRLRVLAQPALARELSVFIRLQKRPAVFGKLPDRQVKAALRLEIDSLLDRLPMPSAAPAGARP